MKRIRHFLAKVKPLGLVVAVFAVVSTVVAQPGTPNTMPPIDPLLQLMMTQPSIDISTNTEITAVFDPPVVRPGDVSIWRVAINALNDSVDWTNAVPFPPGLVATQSARGLFLNPTEGKLKPITGLNYRVRATAEGVFTIPSFEVQVYGRAVTVPASKLEVNRFAPVSAPQSISVELAENEAYIGQPVKAAVLLRAARGGQVQFLQEVKLNGEGFLVDLGSSRQSISTVRGSDGAPVAAYAYETMITPLRAGQLEVSAQGFTAGNRVAGAIIIQGQVTIPGGPPRFDLLDAEPVILRAKPLPKEGELPGFQGAIGLFSNSPPKLSTNVVRVGDVVKLTVSFSGEGNLARLAPPRPPVGANWQVFEAQRGPTEMIPGTRILYPANSAIFTFRMIPLTTEVTATPAIPFSYFDPHRGVYVDATVPPQPVKVLPDEGESDSRVMAALAENASAKQKPLRLADVTSRPGMASASLAPLQKRGWFVVVQAVPLLGLLGIWQWDRRRRFHELHPEVKIRRRARKVFRRERRSIRAALSARDETGYVRAAVAAIRAATAPDISADPRALVGKDVLSVISENEEARTLVSRLFAASDTVGFSQDAKLGQRLTEFDPQLQVLLDQLEARL